MATNYAHFITFPVASTNIFPLVNSSQGGQLVTEFNLKSREMVATNPAIEYAQGPSFVHSLNDFKVSMYLDPDSGNSASSSILQIAPGRAVVNGHYVESLAPITIDLNVANAELQQNSQPMLFGKLSVGIRSYFSTESSMAGSMLVENTDNMYVGVQIVIAKREDFKTPDDCPREADRNNVVADIKLADFIYVNGAISPSSILQNPNSTRYIPSDRIADFDDILDEKYITTDTLIGDMLYTFSGKSKKWCESTGSLMVWDADSMHRRTTTVPTLQEATFLRNIYGGVSLCVPHKQIDGVVLDDNNDQVYIADKEYQIPIADYNREYAGVVDESFIKHVKKVENTLNTYKQFTNGKQIKYIEKLTESNKEEYLLNINANKFDVGDYILVQEDYTVYKSSSTEGTAPSTMYIVLPGGVTSITYEGITQPAGIRLGQSVGLWEGKDDGHSGPPTPEYPDADTLSEWFSYTKFYGTTKDYFELDYYNQNDTEYVPYYYRVSSTGENVWSGAVLLTGGIPLATDSMRGGFYNVSTDITDAGYVYLDNTGHLRLVDYDLLRSGTLAYQLGDDYAVPTTATADQIQGYLDNRVNIRVAFPFVITSSLSDKPAMINVKVTLPVLSEDDDIKEINIYDIESRFGTGVYLHFVAEDTTKDYSKIVINIVNCDKVRIDSSITTLNGGTGPIINVFRSGLYYDPAVINYIRTCDYLQRRSTLFPNYTNFTGFDNLSLWYAQFTTSDPDLVVNGMEVAQPDVQMVPEEIAFWSENIDGDTHYQYALRSITLSNSGSIIGCSLYVANETTVDMEDRSIIGGDFVLPQGAALNYPVACLDNPLQITGTFATAYLDNTRTNWITTDTTFSARTGTYTVNSGMGNGSIVFTSNTAFVPANYTNLSEDWDGWDGWKPGAFHIFYGGTTT